MESAAIHGVCGGSQWRDCILSVEASTVMLAISHQTALLSNVLYTSLVYFTRKGYCLLAYSRSVPLGSIITTVCSQLPGLVSSPTVGHA